MDLKAIMTIGRVEPREIVERIAAKVETLKAHEAMIDAIDANTSTEPREMIDLALFGPERTIEQHWRGDDETLADMLVAKERALRVALAKLVAYELGIPWDEPSKPAITADPALAADPATTESGADAPCDVAA
jgi:hypothetical protein